ncbi:MULTISPECIES: hypothetical protein [unclassified Diaminobutyricimonas]|uniref:hypothetical protein n=1 Tax=unclassified Diaminobutyricimonas TaxID=2643261 RepID=UPI0012F498AA|nr:MULTISPECIES: hypothetical protein [unclassified Diaminobutyricimonas]
MRSTEPIPGNPWPRDMVISVDNPHHLELLLFIRQAWDVGRETAVPELDPVPDVGGSVMPDTVSRDEWKRRWQREWARAWDWYGVHDPSARPTPEDMRAIWVPGQPLHPALPPRWEVEYGMDGIDQESFTDWSRGLEPPLGQPLEETPERVSLPALIEAWQTGLQCIVVLPYAGYFAKRITRRHLAVSPSTRADPDEYRRALATPYQS